jgi:hypothetical protein
MAMSTSAYFADKASHAASSWLQTASSVARWLSVPPIVEEIFSSRLHVRTSQYLKLQLLEPLCHGQ